MEQVFINCRLYNGVESPVGQMGIRVHNEYLNLLKTFQLVDRFGTEKELQKFQLDESVFETRVGNGPTDVFRDDISESELPADSILKMNEKADVEPENNVEAHSAPAPVTQEE